MCITQSHPFFFLLIKFDLHELRLLKTIIVLFFFSCVPRRFVLLPCPSIVLLSFFFVLLFYKRYIILNKIFSNISPYRLHQESFSSVSLNISTRRYIDTLIRFGLVQPFYTIIKTVCMLLNYLLALHLSSLLDNFFTDERNSQREKERENDRKKRLEMNDCRYEKKERRTTETELGNERRSIFPILCLSVIDRTSTNSVRETG